MSGLEAELLTLIQAVREETTHQGGCGYSLNHRSYCTCDWQARFEAELARRWAVSLEDAKVAACYGGLPAATVIEQSLAAARRKAP